MRKSWLVGLLLVVLCSCVCAENYIGYVACFYGRLPVYYFTTKPGGKGKPATVVATLISGQAAPIIEKFDWKDVAPKLVGCHLWARVVVAKTNGWVYCGNVGTTTKLYDKPVSTLRSDVPDFIIKDDLFALDVSNWEENRVRDIGVLRKFLTLFYPASRLMDSDLNIMREACGKYGISFVMLLIKLEQEQSLVSNRNFPAGYSYDVRYSKACGVHDPKTFAFVRGFKAQVESCCRIMRRLFDEFKPGKVVVMGASEGIVYPKNAATYAIYRYCPHYGPFSNGGTPNTGNMNFKPLYDKFFNQLSEAGR